MIIQQNSIKNIRGHFSRNLLYIGLIGGDKGPHLSECGLYNGARIVGFHLLTLEIMSGQVGQESPMNEGFPEKSNSSRFKIKKLNQISSKS